MRRRKASAVTGLVGGWKAYGRSNEEEDGERNFLRDYSGNGRDIELHNFAFSGMSGYGGYPQDLRGFEKNTESDGLSKEFAKMTCMQLAENDTAISYYMPVSRYSRRKMKLRITTSAPITRAQIYIYNKTEWTIAYNQALTVNGVTEVEVIPDEFLTDEYQENIYIGFSSENSLPSGTTVIVEELPDYPGALVSDGADDYGRCIKDFALPDDYTVVALRKIINSNNQGFVSTGSTQGAFIYEPTADNSGTNAWSYGKATYIHGMPALFSYQTKTSYNGQSISFGSSEDTEDDQLVLFTHNHGGYNEAALYDLRIYDHSLTSEELQTVQDEMMSDYEKFTGGGIDGVTYVADWDAKGRSNDEEETMRSQWTDKVNGKVINLSNFSFSEMSGWGGFRFDWSGWASDINSNGGEVIREKNKVTVKNFGSKPTYTILNRSGNALNGVLPSFCFRVTGLKHGASLLFYGHPATGDNFFLTGNIQTDGIYSIPEDLSNPSYYAFTADGYSANEAANLVIEQLPVYPGALVSDGVDDYGRSGKDIKEEVGTMLVYAKVISRPVRSSYILTCADSTNTHGLYIGLSGRYTSMDAIGYPNKSIDYLDTCFDLTREPVSPNWSLTLGRDPTTYKGVNCAIYRIIMIKEQLDSSQLDFLKQKVEKEYRDWCTANGYGYAIPEMTGTESETN